MIIYYEETHQRHKEGHRPVQEVVLQLELKLPHAVDERHECREVHEAPEFDVERIEHMLARLHREELFHRLRRPVTSPAGLVERRIERQDARICMWCRNSSTQTRFFENEIDSSRSPSGSVRWIPSTISLSSPVREPPSSCSYTIRCCWSGPSSADACARRVWRAVSNSGSGIWSA